MYTETAKTTHGAESRILWIDLLRAAMIFAIALGHALCAKPTADSLLNRYIYSFHVPVFFFISGFLFDNRSCRFGSFIKNKLRTLMLPYSIFSVISILAFVILGSVPSAGLDVAIKTTDILPNFLGMLYGNGATGYMKWNLPMWFLPCLFISLLLLFGIVSAINRTKNPCITTLAVLIAIFGIAFINYYLLKIKKLPFGLETAIYMLPFLLSGYWFRSLGSAAKLSAPKKIVISLILLTAGALVGIFGQPRVDYPSSRLGSLPLFYLSAFLSVFGFVLLTQLINIRFLNYMGQNTLAILVMHKFPIVFLQIFLIASMKKNLPLGILIAFGMAVISCLLSLLAGQIITAVFPIMLGKTKKERPAIGK